MFKRIIFNEILSFIKTKKEGWVAISKKEEKYLIIENERIASTLDDIEPLFNLNTHLKEKEVREIETACYTLLIVALLNEVEIHLKENKDG